MATVVVFDKYQGVGTAIADALRASGRAWVLSVLSDGSDVSVEMAVLCHPDVILVEVTTGGQALFQQLRRLLPRSRIVAMTIRHSESEEAALVQLGVDGYFEKRFGPDSMATLLGLIDGPAPERTALVRSRPERG